MADTPNPLEQLVEDLAPEYVALVQELIPVFSPNRPWWTPTLTQDQQLWRWEGTPQDPGPRATVMPWLAQVAPFMHYVAPDQLQQLVNAIFTSPAADTMIPLELIVELPPDLLEMVQAAGPVDASKHIAKMEKLHAARMEELGILSDPSQADFPKPPDQPPVLPVQLGSFGGGWPNFGGVAQTTTSKFNPSEPGLAGG